MQYQGTVSMLIFSNISWLFLKESSCNLSAVRMIVDILFSAKFFSQTNSFGIYWLK